MTREIEHQLHLSFANVTITREVRPGMEDDYVLKINSYPMFSEFLMDAEDVRKLACAFARALTSDTGSTDDPHGVVFESIPYPEATE